VALYVGERDPRWVALSPLERVAPSCGAGPSAPTLDGVALTIGVVVVDVAVNIDADAARI
jgi:hypothetical protein